MSIFVSLNFFFCSTNLHKNINIFQADTTKHSLKIEQFERQRYFQQKKMSRKNDTKKCF